VANFSSDADRTSASAAACSERQSGESGTRGHPNFGLAVYQ